jgi:hypothetical protein
MRIRPLATTGLFLLVVLCGVGCNKNLDESRAKSLLQSYIDDGPPTNVNYGNIETVSKDTLVTNIPAVNGVSNWLNIITPRQFNVPNAPQDGQIMGRLLGIGFIARDAIQVTFPLPQTLTGRISYQQPRGNCAVAWAVKQDAEVFLNLDEQRATIGGGYKMRFNDETDCAGPVSGTANRDGTVDLSFTHTCVGLGTYMFDSTWHFTLNTQGDQTAIVYNAPPSTDECYAPPIFNLRGPTPKPASQVTWSRYTVSPTAQKWASPTGGYNIGKLNISQLSNLSLVGSDVQAHAAFVWTADFNDLGKAFYGLPQVSGTGSVTFSKKPDGTWTVSSYSLTS